MDYYLKYIKYKKKYLYKKFLNDQIGRGDDEKNNDSKDAEQMRCQLF